MVFKCMASSYPPSYYHWYYRGDLVGNDSILETGPLSLNMSGAYTCLALNNVTGKNSTSFTKLRVIGKRPLATLNVMFVPYRLELFDINVQ